MTAGVGVVRDGSEASKLPGLGFDTPAGVDATAGDARWRVETGDPAAMKPAFVADRFQPLPGPSRRERLLRSQVVSRPGSFGAARRRLGQYAAQAISLAALPALPPRETAEAGGRPPAPESWGVLLTLATIIEARDPYMSGHSQRTGWLAARLGRRIGLDSEAAETLYMAGILHDIGKLGIPEAVLNKPGPLSEDQMRLVRRHPEVGYEMLRPVAWLAPVLPAVRYHHENYDGSGYPHGLSGEQIPLMARILRIADMYDALTSPRPYRPARSPAEALRTLADGAGVLTDPALTDAFVAMLTAADGKLTPVER